MTYHIDGNDLELTEEEWQEYLRTREVIRRAKGVGPKGASELMGDVGISREEFLEAGVDGITSLEGWSTTRAERIINAVEESANQV
jgi:hypothetical protein